jgi:hypothetical protein
MSRPTGAPDDLAAGATFIAPAVTLLPFVSKCSLLAASKESVAIAIATWAKRQLMSNSLNKKQLEELLEATRKAGWAAGYAQAKLEIALAQAGSGGEAPKVEEISEEARSRTEKLENLKTQAEEAEEGELYKTRTTVSMTKAIALDYLKSVAPRIIGPSEIIKNSKKKLGVFISFGTLSRAMASLTEGGEVEQIEQSRWRYKLRADAISLKSVK